MRPALIALCLATPTIAQADLVVGPGGFSLLSDALVAANPGDRILLRADAHTFPGGFSGFGLTANKALTIESDPIGPVRAITLSDSSTPTSLTLDGPGTITLRRLRLVCDSFPDEHSAVILRATDIQLEDIEFVANHLGASLHTRPTVLTLCATRNVLLDDVQVECELGLGHTLGEAVVQWNSWQAVSATCTSFFAVDCAFRGSSAPLVILYNPGGAPVLDGGLALEVAATTCVLTRCTLSDGNGGAWGTGPHPATSLATVLGITRAGRSTFAAHVVAHDTTWTPGIDGAAEGPRGPAAALGPGDAPIAIYGGRLGATIDVAVPPADPGAPRGPVAFFLGLCTIDFSFPFGDVVVLPVIVYSIPNGSGALVSISVPTMPALVDTPVIAQVVHGDLLGPIPGNPTLGAAVWTAVKR